MDRLDEILHQEEPIENFEEEETEDIQDENEDIEETEEEDSKPTDDLEMSEDGDMEDSDEDEDPDSFYIIKHRGEEKRIPKDDEKITALISKGLEMDTYKQETKSDLEFLNMIKADPKAIKALQSILTGQETDKPQDLDKPEPEQISDKEDDDEEDDILMTKSEIVNVLKEVLNGEYGMDEIKRARENEKSYREYDSLKKSSTMDIPNDRRQDFAEYFNNTLDLLPESVEKLLATDKNAYLDYIEKVKQNFLRRTDTNATKPDTVRNNDTKAKSNGNTGNRKKAPIQKASTSVRSEQSGDQKDLTNMSYQELKQLAKKKKFKLSDITG